MKKNCIFIIPYFGKFNNYFQLFLNSCSTNENYNWLILTDDDGKYDYPKNVEVVNMKKSELEEKIKEKFPTLSINLNKAYKLCDFKPAYGYIFSEYIKDYLFWGYCDNDMIFGNIDHFINIDEILKYDKIGVNGHFTLYRNSKENNELFMSNSRYKYVFESEKICKFDEEFGKDFGDSINNIFVQNHKKIKYIKSMADIYVKSSNFKLTFYQEDKDCYYTESKDKSIFVWDNGNLYKYKKIKNKIECNEYLYIHLQKRPMKVSLSNYSKYKIIPNSIENIENNNYKTSFKGIKTKHLNLHYFIIRYKNLKQKINNWRKS